MDLEFMGDVIAKNMYFRIISIYMEFKAIELKRSPMDECRQRSTGGLSLEVLQSLVY